MQSPSTFFAYTPTYQSSDSSTDNPNSRAQQIAPHPPHHQHRPSLPDVQHHPVHIAPAVFSQEQMEPQIVRSGFTQTPPDMTIPITPMMPNMPHLDNFISIHGTPYDHDSDSQFMMQSAHASMMDFDASHMMEFTSPPSIFQDNVDPFMMHGKGMQTPNQVPMPMLDGSSLIKSGLEHNSPSYHLPHRTAAGLSPSNSSSSGLQEPEAVIASHHAWPFFSCNRVEKYSFFPPKTAHIYLEGLAQTLRNQATWQAWTALLDERTLDIASERKILTEPIAGWSREKLLAITQSFLHKALDIHKNDHPDRDITTPTSPESSRDAFLMLPPPDVMQYFLRSYAVRYEPYYASVSGGRLDPNALMHSSNSKAASLLILLMVASGASATAMVEARYIASGLTEACRISLFDLIEKDVMQSRDVLVLRAAHLFICLAAWSGDKWHMDVSHHTIIA